MLRDSIWKNKKSGSLYYVIDVAISANNGGPIGEESVIYRLLEGTQLFYRETLEFLEKFEPAGV